MRPGPHWDDLLPARLFQLKRRRTSPTETAVVGGLPEALLVTGRSVKNLLEWIGSWLFLRGCSERSHLGLGISIISWNTGTKDKNTTERGSEPIAIITRIYTRYTCREVVL